MLNDNEAITNDIVASAHIENFALKLFMWADRVSHFESYLVLGSFVGSMKL